MRRALTVCLLAGLAACSAPEVHEDVGAPARRRGPTELALLNDIGDWDDASAAQQDAVIAALDERLGRAFTHIETRSYLSGRSPLDEPNRHRIATFLHVPTGMRLNLIPGGWVRIGSPTLERIPEVDRDLTRFRYVRIDPLLLGATEVTQAQWDRLGAEDERSARDPKLPINGIAHADALRWLEAAGGRLRLPTEQEWEGACRAGTTSDWSFGDEEEALAEFAWTALSAAARIHPVAALRPNAFGLYDLHGNLSEWCAAEPRAALAPARGGNFADIPRDTRVTSRAELAATFRSPTLGFRAARSIR